MGFSLSAFLAIFPDFLLAGILSLIFYLELRNSSIKRKDMPVFMLVKEGNGERPTTGTNQTFTVIESAGESLWYRSVKSLQMTMLAVNIWILLTIVLLPSSNILKILPHLTGQQAYIIYPLLAAAFAVSLLSTVILRISKTIPRMAVTLGVIAAGSFLVFYIPSMQWISTYSAFIKGLILYIVIASFLFLSYGFFSLPSRKIERISIAGTVVSYVFTAAILFSNLVQTLLI